MRWTKRSVTELIAIIATTVVVIVLAILQYQWTGEISRADQAQLKSSLKANVASFDQEFSYDFQMLCESFEIDPEAPANMVEPGVLLQYSSWVNTTARPGLLAGLYIWKTGGADATYLESFDRKTERFQEIAWPERFESLHRFLDQQVAQVSSIRDDRQAIYYPWRFYEDTPALIRPLFQISSNENSPDPDVQSIGFLIVELDADFLKKEYLPGLVDNYFGPLGQRRFEVAVRSAKTPYQIFYMSDPDFPTTSASPDSAINLSDLVTEEARRRGHPIGLQPSSASRQWQFVVQQPAGSLEVAVAASQKRNLAISFGLLAVLAASTVWIFSVARRAERLAKMQMEFVAGVSHELCTPLAVINSAAENLADGVVDDPRQMREYGGMIREQGLRLERLVDQVLLFAAGRFGRAGYELRPIEIAPIVAQSLAVSEPMLRDAGFTVEKEIHSDLPLVVADPAAVSKCIENLVSNAMKYAGANRWVAVRARVAAAIPQAEVQISVEDKGIGIPAADLKNIFEPFYRVQAVRDGQIRGVGLGLYLVKRMMEGMGGRVSVSSELGRGTFFTLHFPVSDPAKHQQGAAA